MTSNAAPVNRLAARASSDGAEFWFLNNRTAIKATGQMTGGAYGLVESWIPPGFSPPLHVHHREDEAFWLLEGEMTLRCGDQMLSGGPGSYFFLPRDVPHTFVIEGEAPVHLLTLLSPGGGEGFFAAAGRPAEHDGFPPVAPTDVERLRSAGGRFGIEIVGPPLVPASVAGGDLERGVTRVGSTG
jgi:mannose-6-phosphate isomerase-like protein (cupin superfamily)